MHEPWTAFVSLGSVVLAVTGCETLYADMGHFGKFPIRLAWLAIVLPALILNYFGQGAALLLDPKKAPIAFYAVAPHWAHYPLVALATVAAIIASQAVISGVFSISKQAVQLGQLPRMEIRHTSATERGQIYVPSMNALLCVGVVLIVLIFKSSDALATAYGIAVTGIMVLSTILVAVVAVRQWHWSRWLVFAVFGALALIDLAFLGANSLKIVEGGWLPLGIAVAVFVVMDTWRLGRRAHLDKMREGALPDRTAAGPRRQDVPARRRHSHLHDRPQRPCARRAAAQHEALQVAARTRGADECRVRGQAVRAPARTVWMCRKLGKGFFEVNLQIRLLRDAGCAARAGSMPAPTVWRSISTPSTFFLGRETLVPSSQTDAAALAHRAVHVAGVECAVAGALLPPAAEPRGRTGRAGGDLVERVDQRLQIRGLRQHRMDGMIGPGAGIAKERGAPSGARDADARIPARSARAACCASTMRAEESRLRRVTDAASRASLR